MKMLTIGSEPERNKQMSTPDTESDPFISSCDGKGSSHTDTSSGVPTREHYLEAQSILTELCHPTTAIVVLAQGCLRRLKNEKPDLDQIALGLERILSNANDVRQFIWAHRPDGAKFAMKVNPMSQRDSLV